MKPETFDRGKQPFINIDWFIKIYKMTRNPFHCTASLKIAYESNSTHLATHETQELAAYDEALDNKALGLIEIDLNDGVKVNYGKIRNLLDDAKVIIGGSDD